MAQVEVLKWEYRKAAVNTGLAKVAVQCSAGTFVVNQSLVLSIKKCAEIATLCKRQTVVHTYLAKLALNFMERDSPF